MNLSTKHSKAIAILEKIPGVNTIQVADFKKFFIVLTPKIGTRTIRDALIKHYNLAGSEYIQRKNAQPLIHTMNRDAFQSILRNRTKKVFAVSRDPYLRLLSCWKQKVMQAEKRYPYFITYYPLIRSGMTFNDFIRAISKIPVWLSEKHFMPQSFFLGVGDGVEIVPLQNINNFFMDNLKIEVGHANSSGNLGNDFPECKHTFNILLAERYALDRYLFEESSSNVKRDRG